MRRTSIGIAGERKMGTGLPRSPLIHDAPPAAGWMLEYYKPNFIFLTADASKQQVPLPESLS